MYRYTVELDIFVHPEYCHKGIGSCLMDKMLNLMDIDYQARAGYEWTVKASASGSVGSRVVKTVIYQVPYDAGDDTDILWTTKFLRRFGFKKAGDIQCMGFKCDKT
jgi:GNAT superfamily N-acetyltransferase